jgi:hypothetical protein
LRAYKTAAGRPAIPSPCAREAALTAHRQAAPEQGVDYGYLFWHRTYRTRCGDFGAWFMSGNGGNAVAIVDQLDAVVVVTRRYYNHGAAMHDQTAALIADHVLPELACPDQAGPGAG